MAAQRLQPLVMLLIDADNVSLDVIEQAMALLAAEHGAVHLRRAYCTAESALKHQAAFKRLGIRPMVNLAAGKNSTDIALAVDAIDLVVSERPDVVVIASSDSDFAPLVARLREKGCRVRGIGQQGKTGDDTQAVYDDFTVLAHKPGGAAKKPAARKSPARKAAAKATPSELAQAAQSESAVAAELAPERPPRRTSARAAEAGRAPTRAPEAAAARAGRPAARKAAGRAGEARAAQPVKAPPKPAEPADPLLAELLARLPELAQGQSLPLNAVAERLRAAGLLSRRASSIKLLARFPQRFELQPPGQPQSVRGLGAA
jgi:uncharacterized protein (TIGR00288 family)